MKRKRKSGEIPPPFVDLVRDAGKGTENIPPNVPTDPGARKKAMRFLRLPTTATDAQMNRKILVLLKARDSSRFDEYHRRFIEPYERVEHEVCLVDPDRYRRIQEWHAHPARALGVPYEAVVPGGDPEQADAVHLGVYGAIDPLHEERFTMIETQVRNGRPVSVRVRVQDNAAYRADVRRMQSVEPADLLPLLEKAVRHGADSRLLYWAFGIGANYTKRFRRWTRQLTDAKRQKRALRVIERLTVIGSEQKRGAKSQMEERRARHERFREPAVKDHRVLKPAIDEAWKQQGRPGAYRSDSELLDSRWVPVLPKLVAAARGIGLTEHSAKPVITVQLVKHRPDRDRIIYELIAKKYRARPDGKGLRREDISRFINNSKPVPPPIPPT